jgi:uncharacterized protein YndB with AHSA1/START domain
LAAASDWDARKFCDVHSKRVDQSGSNRALEPDNRRANAIEKRRHCSFVDSCLRYVMSTTRISRHINAPRDAVYRALLDPRAVSAWKVPDGMTSHIHEFDAREGGMLRISLTYEAPTGIGKTTEHTDTYHGRFVKLVPNEQVVEVDEFETADPTLQGEMTITITLLDADGGTDLHAVHDGLPRGLLAADNELGWRLALAKLAALVDAGHGVQVRARHAEGRM